MKKFLALLLAAFMLTSLCACSSEKEKVDDDVRGEIISGNYTSDEDEEKDETETSSQAEKEPSFSLGAATKNTYKNDFLNLSATLPDNWVFYTDEEILELNNLTTEYLDKDVAEALKDATVIYDMFASTNDSLNNITITLEKNTAGNATIKEILEAQIPVLKSTYQNMGYSDIDAAYQKTKFGGKDVDTLKFTAKIQGIDFYTTLILFKKGDYNVSIAVCSLQTDKYETISSYFTFK